MVVDVKAEIAAEAIAEAEAEVEVEVEEKIGTIGGQSRNEEAEKEIEVCANIPVCNLVTE